MLDLREQDRRRAGGLRAPGVRDEVDPFRGAAREDDFARALCVEVFRGAHAGGLIAGGGAVTQGVDAAVDIAIVVLVVVAQSVEDDAGLLAVAALSK